MPATTTSDADREHLTLADIYADAGKNPDPTGDFAAGRTRLFESGEEFLAYLKSTSSGTAES